MKFLVWHCDFGGSEHRSPQKKTLNLLRSGALPKHPPIVFDRLLSLTLGSLCTIFAVAHPEPTARFPDKTIHHEMEGGHMKWKLGGGGDLTWNMRMRLSAAENLSHQVHLRGRKTISKILFEPHCCDCAGSVKSQISSLYLLRLGHCCSTRR